MQPFDANFYTNFQFDDYRDLPVTVLEHFEWAHNNEGFSLKHSHLLVSYKTSTHSSLNLMK